MKILHTSDWHIGKKVNDFNMLDDQRYVLDQICNIIKREKIDVVIIAGSLTPIES
ncbi:Nuclease SbcCD, D subunit [Candidatus Arthromitus sp. SFB-1]|nr:Nuclease SbcCD, D subunit [Candidatus Arthromitus sp. SFB-1]